MNDFSRDGSGVGIHCACCGKHTDAAGAPWITQPKQLAKELRWEHGKAKGSWVCPECQKHTPVQTGEERSRVQKL
jgi:hypothetical protein